MSKDMMNKDGSYPAVLIARNLYARKQRAPFAPERRCFGPTSTAGSPQPLFFTFSLYKKCAQHVDNSWQNLWRTIHIIPSLAHSHTPGFGVLHIVHRLTHPIFHRHAQPVHSDIGFSQRVMEQVLPISTATIITITTYI